MSIRVWASHPVTSQLGANTAYAEQYCAGFRNIFPTNADGTPASSWVITIGIAPGWAAASADPQMVDLFGGDLPGGINTVPEFIAFLQNNTVGSIPSARRTAIQNALDRVGVVRSDFTLSTPLIRVWKRIRKTFDEMNWDDGGFEL